MLMTKSILMQFNHNRNKTIKFLLFNNLNKYFRIINKTILKIWSSTINKPNKKIYKMLIKINKIKLINLKFKKCNFLWSN